MVEVVERKIGKNDGVIIFNTNIFFLLWGLSAINANDETDDFSSRLSIILSFKLDMIKFLDIL